MMRAAKSLIELVQALPPDLQAEVWDVVEFLLLKCGHKPATQLRQDWARALCDVREQDASLERQPKALDWRGA